MNLFKHSKVRTVGLSSSFALLALLGFAVLCPSNYNDAVHAAETQSATFELDFILQKVDSATFAIEFILAQQLSIEMSGLDADVSANVQPTFDGAQAYGTTTFTASTNSTAGLDVLVFSSDGSSALVNKAASDQIIDQINPITSGTKTLATMDKDTWGYNLSAGTPNVADLNFSALPENETSAAKVHGDTGSNSYQLAFGAKVSTEKKPGDYTKTIDVKVVPTSKNTTALSEAYEIAEQSDAFSASEENE